MMFTRTEYLVAFFGVPLNKVNKILLRMALDFEDELPEWLKGAPKLENLPRWKGEWYNVGENTVKVKKYTTAEIGERIEWVIEELYGSWTLTTEGFSFEDIREAIYFKMRWS